jgi:hypothetical protein
MEKCKKKSVSPLRPIQQIDVCKLRVLDVPRGEAWPDTCTGSRRRIVVPSPSTAARNEQVVVIVIVIVAPPTRTSLRLPVDGRRIATFLAFNTSPADRTSIRIAQPLLE